MNTLCRSFEYNSSSVPNRSQGRRRSAARSVVHVCGHLKPGAMAFTSNDCWSTDSLRVGTTGAVGDGNRFGFAPGFEITLPIHTNGTRPVNTPLPPRSRIVWSPFTSQLKPTRGDHMTVVPGSAL